MKVQENQEELQWNQLVLRSDDGNILDGYKRTFC